MNYLDDLVMFKVEHKVYALSDSRPITEGKLLLPMLDSFRETLRFMAEAKGSKSHYNLHLRRFKSFYVDRIFKTKINNNKVYIKNNLELVHNDVSEKIPDMKYMYKNISQYSSKNLVYDISIINEEFHKQKINHRGVIKNYFKQIIKPVLELEDYDEKFVVFETTGRNIVLGDIEKADYTSGSVLMMFLNMLKYDSKINDLVNIFGDTDILFVSKKAIFKINMEDIRQNIDDGIFKESDIINKVLQCMRRIEVEETEKDNSKDKLKHNIVDDLSSDDDDGDTQDDIEEAAELMGEQDEVESTDEDEAVKEILSEIREQKLNNTNEIDDKERKYLEDTMKLKVNDDEYNIINDIQSTDLTEDEYDITTIDGFNKNKFFNFNNDYDKKYKSVDLAHIAQTFSEADVPLYIQDIKVEDNSDEMNYLEKYTFKFKDADGKLHKVSVNVPKFINGRFMYMGGSKKNLVGQIMNNPISKVGNKVIITTNYNKLFLQYKHGRYLSPNHSRVDRALKKYQARDDREDIFDYKNSYESNMETGETTREFNFVSKKISGVKTDKVDLTFDYAESKEKYSDFYKGVDDQIKVGVVDGEDVILDIDSEKIDGGSYDGQQMSEFLINMSEDHLEHFYKTLNGIKTVPKTVLTSKLYIMGRHVPLILILIYLRGFDYVLDKMNIDYRIVPKDDDHSNPRIDKFNESKIEFQGCYFIYQLDSLADVTMLHYLNTMDLTPYKISELEDSNQVAMILEEETGSHNFPIYVNNYDNLMIDGITKDILEQLSLPTDFVDVLIYANYLLSTGVNNRDTDIRNARLRSQELVTALVYNVVAKEYEGYSVAKKRGNTRDDFTLDKNAVLKKLYDIPNVEEYSTLNPMNELDSALKMSLKGLSGINEDRAYTADKRLYDPSFYGKFAMSTAYGPGVGVVKHPSIDSLIKSPRGFMENIELDEVDDLDSKHILSVSEAITALSYSHDDHKRSHQRVIFECVSL